MKPTTVLMAIVFGSATAISFGLCGTWVVFALVGSDHPQVVSDMPKLAWSCALFLTLTAAGGLALYGTFKNRRWKTAASAATWMLVLAIAWTYWPKK